LCEYGKKEKPPQYSRFCVRYFYTRAMMRVLVPNLTISCRYKAQYWCTVQAKKPENPQKSKRITKHWWCDNHCMNAYRPNVVNSLTYSFNWIRQSMLQWKLKGKVQKRNVRTCVGPNNKLHPNTWQPRRRDTGSDNSTV